MCQALRGTKLNKIVLALKELMVYWGVGNAIMKEKESQDALEVQRKGIMERRVMKSFLEEK